MVTETDATWPAPDPALPALEADALLRELAAQAEQSRRIERQTEQRLSEFERNQSLIAQLIVGLFVAVVIVLIGAYLLAPFSTAADRITANADKARELANTLLLPIVTLVLGYYFGKRSD